MSLVCTRKVDRTAADRLTTLGSERTPSPLCLVDRGELELDAPLTKYRPAATAEYAKTVTLRHLLEMRSGLPRELTDDSATSGVEFDDQGLAGPFLDTLSLPLAYKPGTKKSYSNVGYWLLGGVLEAATQQTFGGAILKLVLEPLDMKNTGFGQDVLGTGRHVQGHKINNDAQLVVVPQLRISQRYSSGGMFSTARDLESFCRAFAGNGLLKEGSRKWMMRGRKPLALLGTGHIPGFTHLINYDPKSKRGILLINNVTIASAAPLMALVAKIENALGAGTPPPRVQVIEVTSAKDGLPDTRLGKSATRWLAAVAEESSENIYEVRVSLLPEGKKAGSNFRKMSEQLAKLPAEMGGFDVVGYRERSQELLVVVRGKRREARITFCSGEDGASIDDIKVNIVARR